MTDKLFIRSLITLSGIFTVYFFMLILTMPTAVDDNYSDIIINLVLFTTYGAGIIIAGFLFMGLIAEF